MFVSLAASARCPTGQPRPTPSPGEAFVLQTQYRSMRIRRRAGWWISVPVTGLLPERLSCAADQAARQYPGPCTQWQIPHTVGDGADLDIRMAYVTPTAKCHPISTRGRIYRVR